MIQEELDHLKIIEVLHKIIVDYLLQIIVIFLLNLEECLLLQNIEECHLLVIKALSTEEECQNQWVIVANIAEMYLWEVGLLLGHLKILEEDFLLIIEDHH